MVSSRVSGVRGRVQPQQRLVQQPADLPRVELVLTVALWVGSAGYSMYQVLLYSLGQFHIYTQVSSVQFQLTENASSRPQEN